MPSNPKSNGTSVFSRNNPGNPPTSRDPSITRQDTFYNRLKNRGVSTTIRREKGHDIAAACGQLRHEAARV